MNDLTMISKLLSGVVSHVPTIATNLLVLLYLLIIYVKDKRKSDCIDKNMELSKKIDKISAQVDRNSSMQLKLFRFFSIHETNKDYIDKMNSIKAHYVEKFSVDSYKNFAQHKADSFIALISRFINECEININNLDMIVNELNSGFETLRVEMSQRMDSAYTTKFFATHSLDYDVYLLNVETILSSFKNHHKDRFLIESTRFMKQFLNNLKNCETDV